MATPSTAVQPQGKKEKPGKLKILGALGSYVSVFQAREIPGSNSGPKFSISLLIPKSDTKQVAAIKQVIETLAVQKFGAVAKTWLQPGSKLHNPLRDGDIERPEDAVYKGHWFINASSKNQPGIVDGKLIKVFEESECYSGCTFNASVNLYAFDKAGKKGVGVGLNNLQVIRKGPRIDGRADAADDFAEFVDEGAGDANDPIG